MLGKHIRKAIVAATGLAVVFSLSACNGEDSGSSGSAAPSSSSSGGQSTGSGGSGGSGSGSDSGGNGDSGTGIGTGTGGQADGADGGGSASGGSGIRVTTIVVTAPNDTAQATVAWPGGTLPVTDGSGGGALTIGPVGKVG